VITLPHQQLLAQHALLEPIKVVPDKHHAPPVPLVVSQIHWQPQEQPPVRPVLLVITLPHQQLLAQHALLVVLRIN